MDEFEWFLINEIKTHDMYISICNKGREQLRGEYVATRSAYHHVYETYKQFKKKNSLQP